MGLAHTLANLNHFSAAGSNYAAAIFSFFNMKQANIYQVLWPSYSDAFLVVGRLRPQQRVLSLASRLCLLIPRGVLLYFWFHDYSNVEMWHNKKIGSLPERVSAPDRFVFFLCSTTMRSPFKIRKEENPSVGTSK